MSDKALQGAILYELAFRPAGRLIETYRSELRRRSGKRRGKGSA